MQGAPRVTWLQGSATSSPPVNTTSLGTGVRQWERGPAPLGTPPKPQGDLWLHPTDPHHHQHLPGPLQHTGSWVQPVPRGAILIRPQAFGIFLGSLYASRDNIYQCFVENSDFGAEPPPLLTFICFSLVGYFTEGGGIAARLPGGARSARLGWLLLARKVMPPKRKWGKKQAALTEDETSPRAVPAFVSQDKKLRHHHGKPPSLPGPQRESSCRSMPPRTQGLGGESQADKLPGTDGIRDI